MGRDVPGPRQDRLPRLLGREFLPPRRAPAERGPGLRRPDRRVAAARPDDRARHRRQPRLAVVHDAGGSTEVRRDPRRRRQPGRRPPEPATRATRPGQQSAAPLLPRQERSGATVEHRRHQPGGARVFRRRVFAVDRPGRGGVPHRHHPPHAASVLEGVLRPHPGATPGLLHVRRGVRPQGRQYRAAYLGRKRRHQRAGFPAQGTTGRGVRPHRRRLRPARRAPVPDRRPLRESVRADDVLRQPRHGATGRERRRLHRRAQLAVHRARHPGDLLRFGKRLHARHRRACRQPQLLRPATRGRGGRPSDPHQPQAHRPGARRLPGPAARPATEPVAAGGSRRVLSRPPARR